MVHGISTRAHKKLKEWARKQDLDNADAAVDKLISEYELHNPEGTVKK